MGIWIDNGYGYECSECGTEVDISDAREVCPFCLATMTMEG